MAGIWTKIVTALRGGANEASSSIVARQTLHILDQEIRNAEQHLDASRSSLACLMAKSLHATRKVTQARAQVASLTRNIETALEADDEAAALEVASQIGLLEKRMEEDARIAQGYAIAVSSLSASLRVSEQKLWALRQQVEIVRTTEFVQQAQGGWAISQDESASRLRSATDALNDLRQRQLETEARRQVQEESSLADADLEQQLLDAGITVDTFSAQTVLQRIKTSRQQQCA
jgi:Phage shock protein A (IM30), suppresses sigma54-dependent transcription